MPSVRAAHGAVSGRSAEKVYRDRVNQPIGSRSIAEAQRLHQLFRRWLRARQRLAPPLEAGRLDRYEDLLCEAFCAGTRPEEAVEALERAAEVKTHG